MQAYELPPASPQAAQGRSNGKSINLVLASYFKYNETDVTEVTFPRLQSSFLAQLGYHQHLLTPSSDIHPSISYHYY